METEVIMKRELWGSEISQKSKSEFFSATDLERAGNKWRVSQGMSFFKMTDWFQLDSTKAFIEELEARYGVIKISGNGRGHHTWVHPFLFIDMALAISPNLKIEVYKWIYDSLLKYRNDSGDSYKKMIGAIWLTINNKSTFKDKVISVANRIKAVCEVTDWNKSTEQQLKLRDKIHENIALLTDVLKDIDRATEISIIKAKEAK